MTVTIYYSRQLAVPLSDTNRTRDAHPRQVFPASINGPGALTNLSLSAGPANDRKKSAADHNLFSNHRKPVPDGGAIRLQTARNSGRRFSMRGRRPSPVVPTGRG